MKLRRSAVAATLIALCGPWTAFAQSQPLPPPTPQLQLAAEASTLVQTDELSVRLAVEKAGPQPAPLNAELLRQLNAALEQARKIAGVEARLSGVQTQPQWDGQGKRKGWVVRGEIELHSRQVAALAELSGRLAESLQLAGLEYRVSAELMEKTRAGLLATAATAFRAKAEAASKALGYAGYEIHSIALVDGFQAQPPIPPQGAKMMVMAESAALPAAGGSERVSIVFNGTVILKR